MFYVDHGDREWVNKKNVANSWNDILTVDPRKAFAFFCLFLVPGDLFFSFR